MTEEFDDLVGRAEAIEPPAGFEPDTSRYREFLQEVDQRAAGLVEVIPTGFPELDKILAGGLQRGVAMVVGGPPGMGKTSFARQIAGDLSRRGHPAVYVSYEQSDFELFCGDTARWSPTSLTVDDVRLGNIPPETLTKLRDGEPGATVMPCLRTIEATDAHTIKELGTIVAEVNRWEARRAQAEGRDARGVLLVVDYLQVVPFDGGHADARQRVEQAAQGLKRIAREHEVLVLALSSIPRTAYTGKGFMPFKESGGIEYTFDVAAVLTFPGLADLEEKAQADRMRQEFAQSEREVTLYIDKNRRGRAGDSVDFTFHAARSLFREYAPLEK